MKKIPKNSKKIIKNYFSLYKVILRCLGTFLEFMIFCAKILVEGGGDRGGGGGGVRDPHSGTKPKCRNAIFSPQ